MSRSRARDCGFKLVFEYLFSKDFVVDEDFEPLNEEEKAYSLSLFNAVKDNFDSLEKKFGDALRIPMTIKDIYMVDHAIILCAMAQIDFLNEEMGLVINEAVRLAKKYSSDKSPSFVNGVLTSIYKN